MDILGLQAAIAELQKATTAQSEKIAALEAQVAKDVNAIADKVIAALTPMMSQACASVDALTVTASSAIDEINNSVRDALEVVKRVDGATVIVKLGPKPE
jgi:hypothetical protein